MIGGDENPTNEETPNSLLSTPNSTLTNSTVSIGIVTPLHNSTNTIPSLMPVTRTDISLNTPLSNVRSNPTKNIPSQQYNFPNNFNNVSCDHFTTVDLNNKNRESNIQHKKSLSQSDITSTSNPIPQRQSSTSSSEEKSRNSETSNDFTFNTKSNVSKTEANASKNKTQPSQTMTSTFTSKIKTKIASLWPFKKTKEMKLGESNNFYYNKELKRWVEKVTVNWMKSLTRAFNKSIGFFQRLIIENSFRERKMRQ